MERLFSPCNRLHDIIESQGRRYPPEILQDLNLNVSTEVLLSAESGVTFADLRTLLGNGDTVAWLTPLAAVALEDEVQFVPSYSEGNYKCSFIVDDEKVVAYALSPEHLSEICDVLLRLVAASAVYSVVLDKRSRSDSVSTNAPTLSYLMEQCPSLKALT
jgi:hypothetical protein